MNSTNWTTETVRIYKKIATLEPKGIFGTGIENADPMVGLIRRNQLKESYDFYAHWEKRLENIAALGIRWIRFGEGYSFVHSAENEFNWNLTDLVIKKCEELNINFIADFLHYGTPAWQHADNPHDPYFQNPSFPYHFARFVKAYVQRYPQVMYFTPINEPNVTATLSAREGIWNEEIVSNWHDVSKFVIAVSNVARAGILARKAIEEVWNNEKRKGEPLFFQNESFEKEIADDDSERLDEAEAFNIRRFSALDLIFGQKDAAMRDYLLQHGMNKEDYTWFMKNGKKINTILGIDYYPWCIHLLKKNITLPQGPITPQNTRLLPYKMEELVKEYYDRYALPLLHMEVNEWPDYSVDRCQQVYDILVKLHTEGYPILGMTWFGDEVQTGWHYAMHGPNSFEETPVGLFYKGQKQPVADLFAKLAKKGIQLITTPQGSFEV